MAPNLSGINGTVFSSGNEIGFLEELGRIYRQRKAYTTFHRKIQNRKMSSLSFQALAIDMKNSHNFYFCSLPSSQRSGVKMFLKDCVCSEFRNNVLLFGPTCNAEGIQWSEFFLTGKANGMKLSLLQAPFFRVFFYFKKPLNFPFPNEFSSPKFFLTK